MKRYIISSGIALTFSFLAACSDNEFDEEALRTEYETIIEDKNNEITKIKGELRLIKDELEQEKQKLVEVSGELQLYDHAARRIMSLIAEKEFNKLENEFNVNFEVIDERVVFNKHSDSPSAPSLPTEIAGLPMYFAYYNPQPEFIEVGYFLYDNDRKYDIHFRYGKNREFKYVTSE